MGKKIYTVIITLPDLAAAHAEYEVKVESTNWSRAVKLACEEISTRQHVRGKHIKKAKIIFSVAEGPLTTDSRESSSSPNRARSDQGLLFEI